MYCGKEKESLVETKVRMYKEQSKKRSCSLPPDQNSLRYDILRKHHQTYIWLRSLEPIVNQLPVEDFGWTKNSESLVPLWYTCPRLPPKTINSIANSKPFSELTSEPPKKQSRISEVEDSDNEFDSDWEHASEFDSETDDDDDSDWEY